jgi:hypothetical protein
VPVWHEKTAQWVKDGKLVLLGVTQEQHPDRCRLFAQWQRFDWPVLHDAINVLESAAVPIVVAIDEHGIVRSIRPRPDQLQADFLDRTFADDTAGADPPVPTPSLAPATGRPDFAALRRRAEATPTAAAWRSLGDAMALWGADEHVGVAIDAYARATQADPRDAAARFRLGVCYRRRSESVLGQPGDFQAAVEAWGQALALDPNQYIWRRRIQQYGPRLDKPYAFYDWVEQAEREVRARGETPVPLRERPGGAEIAQPTKAFPGATAPGTEPDPEGKISRDAGGMARAEVTVVPARGRPGQAVRVHIVLRLDARQRAHWSNEAEPLRVWIGLPSGWQADGRLFSAPAATRAVSEEPRALDFEVKAPAGARGEARLSAYALYNVCDDAGGQCRFLRLDIPVVIRPAE